MATKSQSLLGGLIGSLVVNGLAESIRKASPITPRLDEFGQRAMNKGLMAVGAGPLRGNKRYWTALAGDVLLNTLVFSLAGAGKERRAIPQGLGLGALMGAAMLLSAKPLGIDPDTTGSNAKEKGMTMAYYLLGGLAAAGFIRWMSARR